MTTTRNCVFAAVAPLLRPWERVRQGLAWNGCVPVCWRGVPWPVQWQGEKQTHLEEEEEKCHGRYWHLEPACTAQPRKAQQRQEGREGKTEGCE